MVQVFIIRYIAGWAAVYTANLQTILLFQTYGQPDALLEVAPDFHLADKVWQVFIDVNCDNSSHWVFQIWVYTVAF